MGSHHWPQRIYNLCFPHNGFENCRSSSSIVCDLVGGSHGGGCCYSSLFSWLCCSICIWETFGQTWVIVLASSPYYIWGLSIYSFLNQFKILMQLDESTGLRGVTTTWILIVISSSVTFWIDLPGIQIVSANKSSQFFREVDVLYEGATCVTWSTRTEWSFVWNDGDFPVTGYCMHLVIDDVSLEAIPF